MATRCTPGRVEDLAFAFHAAARFLEIHVKFSRGLLTRTAGSKERGKHSCFIAPVVVFPALR
jgi:hypothetical protein